MIWIEMRRYQTIVAVVKDDAEKYLENLSRYFKSSILP